MGAGTCSKGPVGRRGGGGGEGGIQERVLHRKGAGPSYCKGARHYRRGYPTEREVAQFLKQSSTRLWAVHRLVVQRYSQGPLSKTYQASLACDS